MHRVLHGFQSGHITWGLVLLVLMVFVATPFLKHALYRRSRRGGSIYLPPPPKHPQGKQAWTESQQRQAQRFLQEAQLKELAERREQARAAKAKPAVDDEP